MPPRLRGLRRRAGAVPPPAVPTAVEARPGSALSRSAVARAAALGGVEVPPEPRLRDVAPGLLQ
eukprot:3312220-Alexandrium_andersonii.AAC.1